MNLRFLPTLALSLALLFLVGGCASYNSHSTPRTIRVLTYNIHHGEGMDRRVDLDRIADLIREQQPDLVALQEVDRGAERTQRRDLPAELAALTGLQVVFGKNIDYQGGDYGNAILSRHPVLSSTNLHYRMLRDGEQRGLLQAIVQMPFGEIAFMATHLDFRPDPAERLSNVPEIKAAADRHPGPLVIVAGDFNDHPDSEVHQRMKAMFVDSWEVAGKGDGFTIPSTAPRSRIDYVFMRGDDWQPVHAEVLTSQASDHLPLLVELRSTGR